MNLTDKLAIINNIGPSTAKRLKLLGLETVRDLLYFFPFRYDDFSESLKIKDLQIGTQANIIGHIELIQNKKSLKRRMNITEALISDGEDTIRAIWFNQPFIARNLKAGDKVSLAGKIDGEYGDPILKSPAYEKITAVASTANTQGLVPVYHSTANLTQKQIRFFLKQVLPAARLLPDSTPESARKRRDLLPLAEAIKEIHYPQSQETLEKARLRLAFDEMFLIQLKSQLLRKSLFDSEAEKIIFKERETKDFVDSLPFKLTDAQKKVAWEILQDIGKDKPMARLVEGDVGSGKTVVAALAMFNVALNEKQAVLMVPTEILAKQHYESLSKLFPSNTSICLLTRSQYLDSNYKSQNNGEETPSPRQERAGVRLMMSSRGDGLQLKEVKSWSSTSSCPSPVQEKELNDAPLLKPKILSKKDVIENIKNGNCKIIIGTHALIQDSVEFNDLSLVIIDEQHRFGVEQRKNLMRKSGNGKMPHLLSMTATPIPRSLALAIYGDLDLSIINQMPSGRKPIITSIVKETHRNEAYNFIRKEIANGRQVFVVCPLIEENDQLGVKSVNEEFEKLNNKIFPDLKIGLLHGKLKAAEKEAIMKSFAAGETKILVSTSVIEVGVDVPNASVMVIEGADRFGLAQLHQFRGRVGRSEHQSYCLLFTDSNSGKTIDRLEAMTKYRDGFSLAKIDLKFRGPGEVFGTEQKGFPDLKIASLFDYGLIKAAQEEAESLIMEDPFLSGHTLLREDIEKAQEKIHLE